MKKVGLQLYSIRDVFKDYDTIKDSFAKIADMGYTQAETAGLFIEPELFSKCAKDAGIEIVNTHCSRKQLFEDVDATLKMHAALGTRYLGIGNLPVTTKEEVLAFIDNVNRVAPVYYENGLKFVYHNHACEFIRFEDGSTFFDLLFDGLDPKCVVFEFDCYWLQFAGVDPASFIRKHADRVRFIHLKDMAVRRNADGKTEACIASVGSGNIDYKRIIAAADESNVEYFIVEHDNNWINNDPLLAVGNSMKFIKENLLG